MKLALTSIHVDDPIAAFKFYTTVLGFVERQYLPEHLLAIVTSPDDPDGTGLLLEPSDNPIAKAYQSGVYQAGMPVIVFGTNDIHSDHERLKAKGVVFRGRPETTEWGTSVVFEDTCGNLIQLHQL
jgi:predicted enzyme related to lactoylglutathione lyase